MENTDLHIRVKSKLGRHSRDVLKETIVNFSAESFM